MSIHYFCKLCN